MSDTNELRDANDTTTSNVSMPIVEVTVLEDRAIVTRRGSVIAKPGTHVLSVDNVSACLLDKTVTARLPDEEGLLVTRTEVRRAWATAIASQPERIEELFAQLETQQRVVEAAGAKVDRMQGEAKALVKTEQLVLEEIADDVALGRMPPTGALLDPVRERLGEVRVEKLNAQHELNLAEEAMVDLHKSVEAQAGQVRDMVAALRIELHNGGDEPREVPLTIRYVTAAAAWRPAHTATLRDGCDGAASLELSTAACVWQLSGEDWTNVQLRLSTERPSLGTRPPSLQTDALAIRARSRGTQVQTRAQRISTTGQGAEHSAAVDELPGVDDGGESLMLEAMEAATIASDGRPHRVPLHTFEAPTEVELVCMPELVDAVLTRTRQPHRGVHPLLAGPVELQRNGGYVGRSLTKFVAPGERFDLGWGPVPQLRVHRTIEMLEQTRRTLGSWTRKPRRIDIQLSNLGASPCTIEVQERVMVSEVEKVKVEIDDLHGGTIDDDGIVTWTVRLKGLGQHRVQLAWTLAVHDEVQGL